MKKRAVTKHTANIFHTAKSNMRVRGDMGEHIARRYIQAAGFVIVANNFCVQGAEVDIIARAPDGCLVFFEVKLRAREPVDHAAVLPRAKLARMQKAARAFLTQHQCGGAMRFDLLLLIPNEAARTMCVIWHKNVGLTGW